MQHRTLSSSRRRPYARHVAPVVVIAVAPGGRGNEQTQAAALVTRSSGVAEVVIPPNTGFTFRDPADPTMTTNLITLPNGAGTITKSIDNATGQSFLMLTSVPPVSAIGTYTIPLIVQQNGGGTSTQVAFRNSLLGASQWGGNIMVSTAPPGAGVWRYVVYTFDGTTGRLYVDGTQAATALPSAQTGAQNVIVLASYQNAGEYWNGDLDEVRISASVRTTTSGWTDVLAASSAASFLAAAAGFPVVSKTTFPLWM